MLCCEQNPEAERDHRTIRSLHGISRQATCGTFQFSRFSCGWQIIADMVAFGTLAGPCNKWFHGAMPTNSDVATADRCVNLVFTLAARDIKHALAMVKGALQRFVIA